MFSIGAEKRLSHEIEVIMGLAYPGIDKDKVSIHLQEIMAHYEIKRKTKEEIKNDFFEKVELYLNSIKVEGIKKATLKGYTLELNLFGKFVNKAPVEIKTSDIRDYLSSNDKWMFSTIDCKLSVIRSFYKWLVKEEILLRNPASKIKSPKLPKRLHISLSIEELEIVRESCETLRERALIEVLYSTACRLSEVNNLKISDLNYSDKSMRVIGKGDKERIVYLSEKSYYYLNKYLMSRNDQCEYLFVSERKPIRKLVDRSIERIVEKVKQRINISKKLTPHVMRHTFATMAINNGADLSDVQQLLGHENPSTTLIYAQASEERKKQAHKRFHVQ